MKPSEHAYCLIKKWEQLRCRAYKALPSEKYYTIGYGHYGADVKPNQVITVQQAEELLKKDVEKYAILLSAFNDKLEQHQYDALVSLVFNIGWYNFKYSMVGHYAHKVNITKAPIDVARRIILWVRSGGKVIYGLQRRRVDEANYFMGYEAFILKDDQIIEQNI